MKYKDLKALKSIDAIPDEMFLYVLGNAYNTLCEVGIPLNYERYKDLGPTLIARKNALKIYPEFHILYNKAKSNPSLFTSEDFKRLSRLILILYNKKPLHWAVDKKETNLISVFLNNGADINTKDKLGRTPLSLATQTGNLEIINLLLDKGADVNAKDNSGDTPLLLIEKGDLVTATSLLDRGADINVGNIRGNTPLLNAAYKGDLEMVNLLLNRGANINATDNSGDTALDIADITRNKELVKLLKKRMQTQEL